MWLSYLNEHKKQLGIVFKGKGKRKHQLQRDIETSGEYRLKQEKYDGYNATFMHMKDDHMRNSQLKPGYNIQILIYIVNYIKISNFFT